MEALAEHCNSDQQEDCVMNWHFQYIAQKGINTLEPVIKRHKRHLKIDTFTVKQLEEKYNGLFAPKKEDGELQELISLRTHRTDLILLNGEAEKQFHLDVVID